MIELCWSLSRALLVLASILLCILLTPEPTASAAEAANRLPLQAPTGFSVIQAAGRPHVERPMFATIAPDGALFVLDSGGVNGNDRAQKPPDVIRRLTDTNGDGVYDTSSIYADQIVFGTGLAWYDDALFLTSPPSLWKLEDTNRDGVADKRTELVTGFAFNQSCSDDLHGACLGPDGRIYFLPGRFHHKVRIPGGPVMRDGLGPWLMRCRPDGSDVEFVSGAVGNPVEVAFLPGGDAFVQGTFWAKPSAPNGLRDALIHAVEGGEYSVRDRDYNDRLRTGDFLPALVPLTATAPSGLATYHSSTWGEEYRHNLYTSHFNTGKILRHKLTPSGATYTAETEDFITGAHGDIHFTDVLEDADGSLLVIDTGGWFRACCPASGSAKTEVYGAIYRVTKDDAPAVQDAYGKRLDWREASAEMLVARLADPRFVVREHATEALRKLGAAAIVPLGKTLSNKNAPLEQRLQAVWTLCRIDEEAARVAGRVALRDASPEVRQAAARVAGLHRDAGALEMLSERLQADSSPAVQRQAATALGRLGQAAAVPTLLQAMEVADPSQGSSGKAFREHAIILALIRLDQPAATRAGLQSDFASVRRAALIALDQMPDGKLEPAEVAALLAAADEPLQQAAVEVLRGRPEWVEESVKLIDRWLNLPAIDERQASTIVGTVQALQTAPPLRQLIERRLRAAESESPQARQILLHALAACGTRDVPQPWQEGIQQALSARDEQVRLAALQATAALELKELSDRIHELAAKSSAPAAQRLAALRTLTGLQQELTGQEFDYLLSRLTPEIPVHERLTALSVVVATKHPPARLRRLLPLLPEAGPIELPHLLAALASGDDAELGLQVVAALSQITIPMSPDLVAQTLQRYPDKVREAGAPLLARLKQAAGDQVQRLDDLEQALERTPGDVARGRALFFAKAACHLCHSAEGRGGNVGPNLAGIGAIRTRRDLLEAIVFPSATFARGYEPVVVVLTDGRILTGLMGRETPKEMILSTVVDNKPVEVPVRREEIEQVQLGRISTMPQGLESPLSPQELSDLVAYLQQLRTAPLKSTAEK